MDNEIRKCFFLYLNHIKSTIKGLQDYDIQNMTILQIRAQIDVIHMQYILTSSFSVSETSPCVIGYKHLKEMIDGNCNDIKYQKLDNDVKLLTLENTILKRDLDDLKSKISDSLFPSSINLCSSCPSIIEQNGNQPKGWFFK